MLSSPRMTSSLFTRVCYIVILTGSIQPEVSTAEILTSHSTDSNTDPEAVERHPVKYVHLVDSDKTSAEEKQTSASLAERKHGPCAVDSGQIMARETRKWGEKSMSAWGKRGSMDELEDGFLIPGGVECNEQTGNGDTFPAKSRPMDKRKWGENTMQVWGKRNAMQQDPSTEKRKWGEKTMSAWGKRQAGVVETEDDTNAIDKRKSWGSNTMQVWGKRTKPRHSGSQMTSGIHHEMEDQWDLGSEPASNGVHSSKNHASSMTSSASDSLRPAGGYWGPKRKWETNVMKVWGKRTAATVERLHVPEPSASVNNDELLIGNEY